MEISKMKREWRNKYQNLKTLLKKSSQTTRKNGMKLILYGCLPRFSDGLSIYSSLQFHGASYLKFFWAIIYSLILSGISCGLVETYGFYLTPFT